MQTGGLETIKTPGGSNSYHEGCFPQSIPKREAQPSFQSYAKNSHEGLE